jgi:hypothetical protein
VSFTANYSGLCISFVPNGKTVLVGVANAYGYGKLLLIHAETGRVDKTVPVPGSCSSIAVPGMPTTSSSAVSP